MTENLGRLQRTIRILISVSMLIYGYLAPAYVVLALGLIILVTAMFAWCPIVWAVHRKMIKSLDK